MNKDYEDLRNKARGFGLTRNPIDALELKAYSDFTEARKEIGRYIRFYNIQRPHQALGYKTPADEYHAESIAVIKGSMLQSKTSRVRIPNSLGIAGFHL